MGVCLKIIRSIKKRTIYQGCRGSEMSDVIGNNAYGPLSMADSTGFYKEFLAERQEILCHKWIESEKAGYDIGFERALIDWVVKYRSTWREKRHRS